MSDYKKHHYVPKFLLRQFSGDGKRIDVFHIQSKRTVSNVGIKEQCYEDFFYGKDPIIEKSFSELESFVSDPIRSLSKFDLKKVGSDDIHALRQFILYQCFRTKGAAERVQRFTDAAMRPVMKRAAQLEGLSEDLIDKVRFELTNPQLHSLNAAAAAMPAIMDLSIKVMTTPDDARFILSDNPVILYNQFIEHHPDFKSVHGSLGIANKGIQIFMPISPITCICLFDSGVYQYGKKRSPVGKMSKVDVRQLNTLQAFYADKCLYWHPQYPPQASILDKILEKASLAKLKRKNLVRVFPEHHQEKRRSEIVVTHTEDARIGAKFSFSQIIEKNMYKGIQSVPLRSKCLLRELKEHSKQLDEQSKELMSNTMKGAKST